MFSDNAEIALYSSQLASTACIELFEAYGVSLAPSDVPWGQSDEALLSGVMGFVGEKVRGTCLLAGEYAPLAASSPVGGRLRDWVGELANQLAGRLKTKLLARNIEVALTTPIVLSGVRLQPLPRGMLEPVVFTCAAGVIMVWVEVEASGGVIMTSERPKATSAEGDILIF
jgi:hypothetical protein